ncbi:DUF2510 domain-containing protein [Kitasatospora sp. NPDC058162]|uniref:DUF2510 domain-containing protein n=1 Tax=Kitasatospora sp. NPDC058162 TaxID=3346362 RepID=UPI0036D8216E
MSNSTPPGWYPAPGTDGAPGNERWWDGQAWTSDVRPLPTPGYGYPGAAAPHPAQEAHPGTGFGPPSTGYGYPGDGYGHPGEGYGYPGPAPYAPPPSSRRARPGVIVGTVAGVLAVAGIVAAFAFSHSNGPLVGPLAGPTTSPTLSSTSRGTLPPPTPTPSPTTPAVKPEPVVTGIAPDPQHAITVPILDGWTTDSSRPSYSMFEGTGPYTCDGGHRCVRGMFAVSKDVVQGATAKDAADAAMPVWAGGLYPGVNQHTDYGSGVMSVDGVPGYVDRWHVTTSTGAQGYVLLATFQAKGGGYVVFEGSVDDDALSPDKDSLEEVLKGITQSGSSSSGT